MNDDILKILMAKGIATNGVPSEFFEASNVLLGFFFKKWLAWFPHEPWFGWFLYGLQAFSLWAFLWIQCSRPQARLRVLLFILACLGLYFIFFTYLQFTFVALWAAQSGLWLLYFSWEVKNKGKRAALLFMAGGLLWLASLLRLESLFLMLPIAAPLFIWRAREKPAPDFTPAHRKFLIWTAVLIGLCGLFHMAYCLWTPEWRDYWNFHHELCELNEYQVTEYSDRTKASFDAVGWSPNDYWLFKHWYFMDPRIFSTDKIQALEKDFPRFGFGEKYGAYGSLAGIVASHWDARILAFFLAFALVCGTGKWRLLLVELGWVVAALLGLLYFLKATDRVTLPILVFLVNSAVYFADGLFVPLGRGWKGKEFVQQWLGPFLVLITLAVALPELRNYHQINLENRKIEARMQDDLGRLKAFQDQLIVAWDFPFETFNAFDDFERFRPFRFFVMNAFQRSPAEAGLLRDFGLQDFGRDLVDNPRVLLNCSAEEGAHYAVYLEENYGIHVVPQKVFEGDYFKVFSIRSQKGPGRNPGK